MQFNDCNVSHWSFVKQQPHFAGRGSDFPLCSPCALTPLINYTIHLFLFFLVSSFAGVVIWLQKWILCSSENIHSGSEDMMERAVHIIRIHIAPAYAAALYVEDWAISASGRDRGTALVRH